MRGFAFKLLTRYIKSKAEGLKNKIVKLGERGKQEIKKRLKSGK